MSDDPDRTRAALRLLLPTFLKNRRADVGRLREALDADDFATIALLAHNLRGNGASYGFPELSALGALLEAAAQQRDRGAILVQVTGLDAAVRAIEVGRDP